MATAEEKRDLLSKRMAAALLQHQVTELERSVDSINFSRDSRLYDPSSKGRGGRGGRGGPGRGVGAGGRAGGQRERRVVDASALVHALPVLKRWIREDAYQLIIPLQALSTLDILKRAPNPLHDLARDATRFLETQLNIARQIEGSFGGVEADSRIRLRAQAAKEELSWSEVEKLFTVPDGFVVEVDPATVQVDEDGEPLPPPVPSAEDIPRSLRSSLQCALYFQQSSQKDIAPLLLFNSPDVASPSPYILTPPSAEPAPPRQHNSAPSPIDFDALSHGNSLTYWLKSFFPSTLLSPIPASQIVAAREWFKAQAALKESGSAERGGVGRGRGRGSSDGKGRGSESRGGGRGRRGETSKRTPDDGGRWKLFAKCAERSSKAGLQLQTAPAAMDAWTAECKPSSPMNPRTAA